MSDKWLGDGGPAFPVRAPDGTTYTGVTLREYFAAHAPAAPAWWWRGFKATENEELILVAEHEARWRYVYADQMLKARGHK